MEQENFMNPMEENKLPTSLNVLTILTFIGSGIGLLFSLMGYFNAEKNLMELENTINSPDLMSKIPDFMKSMFTSEAVELARQQVLYKLPLIIIGFIGITLCVFGALQMRQRKMQGYYLWLIGEIFPVIATVIFVGFGIFSGFMGIIMICFLLIFIILYTLQRKHLTN